LKPPSELSDVTFDSTGGMGEDMTKNPPPEWKKLTLKHPDIKTQAAAALPHKERLCVCLNYIMEHYIKALPFEKDREFIQDYLDMLPRELYKFYEEPSFQYFLDTCFQKMNLTINFTSLLYTPSFGNKLCISNSNGLQNLVNDLE
jgi:hypothetical protein